MLSVTSTLQYSLLLCHPKCVISQCNVFGVRCQCQGLHMHVMLYCCVPHPTHHCNLFGLVQYEECQRERWYECQYVRGPRLVLKWHFTSSSSSWCVCVCLYVTENKFEVILLLLLIIIITYPMSSMIAQIFNTKRVLRRALHGAIKHPCLKAEIWDQDRQCHAPCIFLTFILLESCTAVN